MTGQELLDILNNIPLEELDKEVYYLSGEYLGGLNPVRRVLTDSQRSPKHPYTFEKRRGIFIL